MFGLVDITCPHPRNRPQNTASRFLLLLLPPTPTTKHTLPLPPLPPPTRPTPPMPTSCLATPHHIQQPSSRTTPMLTWRTNRCLKLLIPLDKPLTEASFRYAPHSPILTPSQTIPSFNTTIITAPQLMLTTKNLARTQRTALLPAGAAEDGPVAVDAVECGVVEG